MIVAGSLGSCTRPGENLGRHAVKLCVHGVGDASQRTHKEAVTVGGQATHCDGLSSEGGGGRREGGEEGGGYWLVRRHTRKTDSQPSLKLVCPGEH